MDRNTNRRWLWAAFLILLGIGGSLVVQNGWPLFWTTLGAIVTVGSDTA